MAAPMCRRIRGLTEEVNACVSPPSRLAAKTQAVVADEMTQMGRRWSKARSKKRVKPAKPHPMDKSIPADESTGKVFRARPSAANATVSKSQPARSNQSPPPGALREPVADLVCQSQAALTKKIKAHAMAMTP
jgi:hypothetical protein